MVATMQAVRLGEVMGLPPVAGSWSVTGRLLSRASEELFATRHDLALRLMLRVVRYDQDKLIKELLSRTRVARLPEASIRPLTEICERMVAQSLPPFVSVPKLGGAARIERVRVAVEVQSRVSVRLSGPEAVEAFHKAMGLYADRSTDGHVWMTDPLRNLLSRTWEALRPAERTELALEVLACPIKSFEGFCSEGDRRYPDPGLVLGQTDMEPPHRTGANEREWQRVVSLLVRALGTEGEPRARAALRLAYVAIWDRLNQGELADVAGSLWTANGDHAAELPTGTGLRDWVFLLMPEPRAGTARDAFRRKWTVPRNLASLAAEEVDEALWELGDAKRNARRYGYSVEFSKEESVYVEELIAAWSIAPLPQPSPILDRTRPRMYRAAVGCAELLKHLSVSRAAMEALLEKLKALEAGEMAGLMLVPALMVGLPERRPEIVSLMRNALASDGRRAKDAAQALLFWLRGAADEAWEVPPDELIREVGVIVATRRKAALVDALNLVEWVFVNGDSDSQTMLKDRAVEGLAYLLSELDYRRDDMARDLDVPLVRWRCAGVAAAMEQAGIDEEIVRGWIRESAADPMPEVRHAGDEIQFRLS